MQIPRVGVEVGNLSVRFCGETQPGPYSSCLTLCISRGGTRELGTAELSQSSSPYFLSCNTESSSCPTHSTQKAPEFLLNSQTSTFLLNHNRLKKKERQKYPFLLSFALSNARHHMPETITHRYVS